MTTPRALLVLGHRVLLLLVLAITAWVLYGYGYNTWVAGPDFDGALNFNVSDSVLEGRGYGSFYERWALFPIETQTNGPLVLPTALSMAVFGKTPLGFQLVNLLYVLGLYAVVLVLLRRLQAESAWGDLSKPSRASRGQGAPRAGTAVYKRAHEDSEHGATQPRIDPTQVHGLGVEEPTSPQSNERAARAAGFQRFSWVWPLSVAVLALQVPGMAQYALFGYGEVAAVAWGLAALLVLAGQLEAPPRARSLLLAGVLLGLSVLTKTVSLIWFPSILGLYGLLLWREHGFVAALKAALWIALGLLLALSAWEIYRAISLGSLGAWAQWWADQYAEISKQAGVDTHYGDTAGWTVKLARHGTALAGYLQLGLGSLAALGLVWAGVLGLAVQQVWRHPRILYALTACASAAAVYFYWWLLVTPTEMMWLRRVMLGLLFALLAASMAALMLWRAGGWRRGMAVLAAGVMAIIGYAGQQLWDRADRAASTRAEYALAEAVRALPEDALLFGSGWWQSPVIALLSGRRMHNEEAWTPQRLEETGRPAYLVMDRYALDLAVPTHQRLAWRCDCEPVHLAPGGRIYRVRALYDSPETSPVITLRYGPDADIYGPGFSSQDEGGFRWTETEAELQFAEPIRASRWVLSLVIPAGGYVHSADGVGITLEVEFVGCGRQTLQLPAGHQDLLLTSDCPEPVQRIRLHANDHLDPAIIRPDTRKLALLFKSIQAYPVGTPTAVVAPATEGATETAAEP